MKKTLTIIAAFVFGIQALMSIIDIFTIPTAGEIPTAGNIVLLPIDIEFTVLSIVFFAAGLCLSIAVLLPDKKPKSASLNISEQTQNITALKKNLVIIATIGFGLDLLFNNIIPYLQDYFMLNVRYWALLFRDNLWGYTFMSIPVAGLCLSIAVLLPYKEPKAAPAEMSQQSLTITAMKNKLAIIAVACFGFFILYDLYHLFKTLPDFYHENYLFSGTLNYLLGMLGTVAGLCLSIAVLLPYKELRSTSPVTDQ